MSDVATLPQLVPDLKDFSSCWSWLHEHPYFFYAPSPKTLSKRLAFHMQNEPGFAEALDIDVYKVDPELDEISPTEEHNVQTRVRLEIGPWLRADDSEGSRRFTGDPSHEYALDVETFTFEEAICELARKVRDRYGSYPEYRLCSHCLSSQPAGPTNEDDDWFCSESCATCGPYRLVTTPSPDRPDRVRMIPPDELFNCEHFALRLPEVIDLTDGPKVSIADRTEMVRKIRDVMQVPEVEAGMLMRALVHDGWERGGGR